MIANTINWDYIELNDYFMKWLDNDGHKVMDYPKHASCPTDRMLKDVWHWIFRLSCKRHEKRLDHYHRDFSDEECHQKCKEFFDYHIYMAWLCIRLLLSNGFHHVTYKEVSVLYAEHHKTVSKAFDNIKPDQSDAGHDNVRYQLYKIVATANMFQKLWKFWIGSKPQLLPSIVIGAETEKIEDYWIDADDSENNDVDDYIEDDEDYFDDNTKKNMMARPRIEVVNWDTDKVFDFISDRLYDYNDKEYRLREPEKYANVKYNPVKGMIYDISCWLVNKEYEKYHIFRISYVVEKLMTSAFRCVNIDEIKYDFTYFPEYMEKCFRTWSDDEEDVKKCINKIYLTVAQFQHKWRYLKNKMPLKIGGLTEKDDPEEYNDADDEFYEYKMWLNDSDCDLSWSDVEEQAKKWDEREENEPTVRDLLEQRDLDIYNIEYKIRRHNEKVREHYDRVQKSYINKMPKFDDEI